MPLYPPISLIPLYPPISPFTPLGLSPYLTFAGNPAVHGSVQQDGTRLLGARMDGSSCVMCYPVLLDSGDPQSY